MIREEIEEKATKRLLEQIVDTIIVMVLMVGIIFIINKLIEVIVSGLPKEIYYGNMMLIGIISLIVPVVVTSFLRF